MKAARYAVVVKADVNDGDYIEEISEFSEREIKLIKPLLQKVAKALNKNEGKWEDTDEYIEKGWLTKTEVNSFENLVPIMDNQDVHTITDITVYKYSEKTRIY